ncbi:ABC-F family ATP-binding cassette domain-containing protein [Tumebacillus permanentifrigoris]|uniref:ATP-binding cassette subfamily F protein uup n=1 Tax=Tumebacillus permanentifrigoris TaxID=378543 RepID=A0A316D7D8_9BACL|nr:ABC-F family ATP-binding cassette domain-containing protein [Tumebacillus permanentifrigoris]PWK11488.1 ATP-binding cassette subfamily F protein uup [Tumebacillus permanentifrigoris]
MNLISILNLSKTHGEKTLFQDLTFGIETGERIGLIGVNGTGKSTLLRTIAGTEHADSGQIVHTSNIRVEFLPQNPQFDEHLTVLQSVFQGDSPVLRLLYEYEQTLTHLHAHPDDEQMQARLLRLSQEIDQNNAWEMEANAKNILNRLGITNYDAVVGTLSGGQRKRVAMARALIRPADLLILDEPTNHIDNETVDWLEGYLAKSKAALLMITHDRYFLDRVTNRIIELDKGKLYSYNGNYATFLEGKAAREESTAASEDKRQNLLRRELEWLHRGAKARTTKQKARVDFATTLRDQKVEKASAQLDIAIGSQRLGKKVLELTDVTKSFGERTPIRNLSLLVGPGERIGIVGPNGSGKSTLLNLIAGRLQPDSGTVDTGSTVKLAYYTQESLDMNEEMRVIEYIREVASYIKTTDGETISAGQMLERFLFPPHQQWTPIAKLSGGERRRLYLLRILMSEPNVLLLDEPTNDLDIQTLTILEDYLDHFDGTVITVSHDRYFLDRAVDRLVAFEGSAGIFEYLGMYSSYQAEREKRLASASPTSPSPEEREKTQAQRSEKPRARKMTFAEQKEYESIDERIASLETKLAAVQAELAKGGSDYTHLQQLTDEENRLTAELETAVERWAELNELAEEIARTKN